jgi:hypothetical protein
MKHISAMVLATAFLAAPAFAGNTYSSQTCANWFAKIDRNHDGGISVAEGSEKYLARITLANEDKSSAYIMTRGFFLAECAIGSLGKPRT